jgi:hypothetical protein
MYEPPDAAFWLLAPFMCHFASCALEKNRSLDSKLQIAVQNYNRQKGTRNGSRLESRSQTSLSWQEADVGERKLDSQGR